MKEQKNYRWLEMICITTIIIIAIIVLWYMWATTHPAIAIFRFEMDNNTLEAVKIMQNTR